MNEPLPIVIGGVVVGEFVRYSVAHEEDPDDDGRTVLHLDVYCDHHQLARFMEMLAVRYDDDLPAADIDSKLGEEPTVESVEATRRDALMSISLEIGTRFVAMCVPGSEEDDADAWWCVYDTQTGRTHDIGAGDRAREAHASAQRMNRGAAR